MKEPRKSPPSKPQSKPEDKLDEELEESFPASDPPSNTPTAAGGPERSQTKPPKPDKSTRRGWSGAAAIAQLARDGQAFDLVFGVTLKGAIFTVQKALPLMREGGLIVLMGRQGARPEQRTSASIAWAKRRSATSRRSWTLDLKGQESGLMYCRPAKPFRVAEKWG
jgi:hypothetical protein